MPPILLAQVPQVPVSRQPMEIVERKGLGHPDSLCDAMMEAIAVALSQAYIDTTGQVLHYNLDKGLLVAGQTSPALGGGRVDAPMRLIVGDRATTVWQGQQIPVREIAEVTARRWLKESARPSLAARFSSSSHTSEPSSANGARACSVAWGYCLA